MTNTITTQKIVDGERNVVTKTTILGDASGEETATQLLDVSTFSGTPGTVKIIRIQAYLSGFSVSLLWDATTDVTIIELPADDDINQDFKVFGGLINNSGTGKTGDIMFTTVGLGDGDTGTIVIEMQKK